MGGGGEVSIALAAYTAARNNKSLA
jgi:hypothetical protein